MGSRHVGDVLSLVRQGLTLGVQFGTGSVEALLWVAETVEEGVYEAGSLRWSPEGIAFALGNPPLRVGAFTSLTIRVNGEEVPAARVRLRSGAALPWRSAATIGDDDPLPLGPGDRTEFSVAGEFGREGETVRVRLELRTPAIPPLVWFQFQESAAKSTVPP